MFGIIKSILGAGKGLDSIDKVVDNISSGLDKLIYTDQEKSEMSKEGYKLFLDYLSLNKDENSIRSKTRRIIAVSVVGNYLALLNAGVVAFYYEKPEFGRFIFETAKTLTALVVSITVFYFGYYAIANIVEKAKKK